MWSILSVWFGIIYQVVKEGIDCAKCVPYFGNNTEEDGECGFESAAGADEGWVCFGWMGGLAVYKVE